MSSRWCLIDHRFAIPSPGYVCVATYSCAPAVENAPGLDATCALNWDNASAYLNRMPADLGVALETK